MASITDVASACSGRRAHRTDETRLFVAKALRIDRLVSELCFQRQM